MQKQMFRLKKSMAVAILVTVSGFVCSLSALPAGIGFYESHTGYVGESERDTALYHHSNTVDQLWFGTNRWAVKYNLGAIAANVDSMTVQSVSVYFPSPSTGDTFDLKIYTDRTLPLDSLAVSYENLSYQRGWNLVDIQVSDQITGDFFWIEIGYNTNSTSRFMAASSLNGANSYFWVPPYDGISGYFANMAENNISAEFLINLNGILHFDGVDLVLKDFELLGNFDPAGSIYPRVTIKNNSNQTVQDLVGISVQLTNPMGPEDSWNITLPLDINLAPGQEVTESFTNSYRLLGFPSQYRLRAELQYDDDLYTVNNIIRFNFNNYQGQSPFGLTENFIRTNHTPSSNILNTQQNNPANDVLSINYFIHPQDIPYYNTECTIRKDFYSLSGYPFTVVNGIKKIAGYHSEYADSLLHFIDSTIPVKTPFQLLSQNIQKIIDPDEMLMYFRFPIRNQTSHIFIENLNNLRMFMALVEHGDPDYPGNNLILLNRYQSTGALTLGFESEHTFLWEANLSVIDTINYPLDSEHLNRFSIIFWIQDNSRKELYFASRIGLNEFQYGDVNIEDDIILVPEEFIAYPNPFNGNGDLNIRLKNSAPAIRRELKIYNIKGQLIRSIPDLGEKAHITWDGSTDKGCKAASGVYLLKMETETVSGSKLSSKQRLLLIR